MTQTRYTGTRPQMALQSYLDGLLQEATEDEALLQAPVEPAAADEFAEAVREEQARDARQPQPAEPLVAVARPAPRPFAEPAWRYCPA